MHSFPAIILLMNWRRQMLIGFLVAIPGEPAWCMACLRGAIHQQILILHSHILVIIQSTAVSLMDLFIAQFIRIFLVFPCMILMNMQNSKAPLLYITTIMAITAATNPQWMEQRH